MLRSFQGWRALSILPFLFSCQSAGDPTWTVMVYMAGDNNLSAAANQDLLEMESVGSDSNLQIVVQYDSIDGSVKRLTVQPGGVTVVEDLGEQNMADPQTLTNFLLWAGDRFPGPRRVLILWDHGNGYHDSKSRAVHVGAIRESPLHAYGILQDDTNGTPCCLSNRLVRQAIEASGIHFDLLGFDASQMAQIETAYEYRNVADLLVFSQETGQANGWDYAAVLGGLKQYPGIAPVDLANLIVNSYREFYEQIFYPANPNFEPYLTISAVRLGGDMEALGSVVDDLSVNLSNAIQNPSTRDATITAVGTATAATQSMVLQTSPYVYLDLFDLGEKLLSQPGLDPSTQKALGNLQLFKDRVVMSEYHGQARTGATGLSIVFFKLPEANDLNLYDPNYVSGAGNLDFLDDFSWNEFLSLYYTAAGLS